MKNQDILDEDFDKKPSQNKANKPNLISVFSLAFGGIVQFLMWRLVGQRAFIMSGIGVLILAAMNLQDYLKTKNNSGVDTNLAGVMSEQYELMTRSSLYFMVGVISMLSASIVYFTENWFSENQFLGYMFVASTILNLYQFLKKRNEEKNKTT